MHLVKTYTGSGQLLEEDGKTVANVTYRIDVFQQMIDMGTGQKKPGMKKLEGSIFAAAPSVLHLLVNTDFILVMEDGRKLSIFISDSEGGIGVRGDSNEVPL